MTGEHSSLAPPWPTRCRSSSELAWSNLSRYDICHKGSAITQRLNGVIACLSSPAISFLLQVEVASKYSTVDTLRQQYLFVPAKYKDCYLAFVLNELSGSTSMVRHLCHKMLCCDVNCEMFCILEHSLFTLNLIWYYFQQSSVTWSVVCTVLSASAKLLILYLNVDSFVAAVIDIHENVRQHSPHSSHAKKPRFWWSSHSWPDEPTQAIRSIK